MIIRSTATLAASLAAAATAAVMACPPAQCVSEPAVALPQVSPALPVSLVPEARPQVDLAICLDVSGSMSGLIDSARQKIWAIVNDLALAQPTPTLRVALLAYGHTSYDAEAGWVRVETPFTSDLDLVSQRLFALSTNGGTELVGRVLDAAGQLDWNPSSSTLRLAVVAGNESADQDQAKPYRDVCADLIARGILVNSIYCGDLASADAPGWQDVARLADGQFASIDQNQGTVVVETPFDVRLVELNTALNATYIPYGGDGQARWTQQQIEDSNAEKLNQQALAARCQTKASALYCNSAWDLVDACAAPDFVLADVADDALPEIMRPMSLEERTAYVKGRAAERAALKTTVGAVTRQQQAFIQAEMERLALSDDNAFDAAIRRAIRAQAEAIGFRFADAPAPAPAAPAEIVINSGDGC